MSLDIRGVWKYQDLLKEYSELQARASKAMLRTDLERDAANKECQRLAMEVDRHRAESKAAHEEVKRLEKGNREVETGPVPVGEWHMVAGGRHEYL